jgi:hypothetical protein
MCLEAKRSDIHTHIMLPPNTPDSTARSATPESTGNLGKATEGLSKWTGNSVEALREVAMDVPKAPTW